jgi:hypothetical protein
MGLVQIKFTAEGAEASAKVRKGFSSALLCEILRAFAFTSFFSS